MSSIAIRDARHWHQLRAGHVGASEVAALFDLHPQISLFQLWHCKNGSIPLVDLSADDRVFWGTVLEPAIAAGIAEKMGWQMRKVRRYLTRDDLLGFGATLDYEIIAHDRGPGVLEIKCVDWLVFREWEDGEPPMVIELQLQHQLAVIGRDWGAIGVLIGGNDLRVFTRDRHDRTIARIEAAVADFWDSLTAGRAPKPDWNADGEAVATLYRQVTKGKTINLTGDNRLPELCAEYLHAGQAERISRAVKSAAKAEIMTKIGDAETAICGDLTIGAKQVPAQEIYYPRDAYRTFHISERKSQNAE